MSDKQEWQAYYKQNSDAYKMELATFRIHQNGKVVGTGTDSVGDFEINGTYQNHDIKWIKHYVGRHSIFYSGHINSEQTSINGVWSF